jgi:hypothetical protein
VVVSLSYPPYEVVLPNVFLKLIQLHQRIRFTSTATVEAAIATAVPNAPSIFQEVYVITCVALDLL